MASPGLRDFALSAAPPLPALSPASRPLPFLAPAPPQSTASRPAGAAAGASAAVRCAPRHRLPLLLAFLLLPSFPAAGRPEAGGAREQRPDVQPAGSRRGPSPVRADVRKLSGRLRREPGAEAAGRLHPLQFLGSTEVEQPKGTEVVRDAVRKLKFARHIKKSEGQKTPKVELQISIYGVKILDPKTKEVQHNCQLHRISFCADDKTDKRIFTFICKDSESNKHLCYVFDSEKCAEEITLTIGQAFDLAYRKFLESGGKDVETRKQIAGLQKRIQELETENTELKNKVQDLENQLRITQVHAPPAGCVTPKSPSTDIFDMVPFSPISPQSSTPTRNGTQPPPVPSRSAEIKRDLFGAEPFDPFSCGAGDFPPDIQSKLDEMQEGFKMGLTLEGTVFCLDPLDSRC
ncbi:PTB domain-containing engulfment adapter protein 1 isoform X3 [Gallus gallus]|uniref:PTB domain-containing engulfment adapter protein 1 isoform X3 n=1 Tax=Gallus gallus TaxID=9031 RepID=UPI001F00CAAA|nr:PTB domain-containing engulfment adapter protein 1 isoform X3 [Gallus gallus]XP_046799922.1 PTB domain-containing engulfment adapter protein 1 isoform X3 [Gallus gallus]